MYFYLTDEAKGLGFSKMTYALTRMASFMGMFIGAVVYAHCLKSLSIRWMMVIASFINFFASLGQVVFIRGFYFGLSPAWAYGFIELISDSFSQAFVSMPAMALVAKLIPPTIESALFAFFTGLANLNYHFIGRLTGNAFNLIYDVKKDDMTDFWRLLLIQAVCSLLPILFIWILPTTPQVRVIQKKIREDEKRLKEE